MTFIDLENRTAVVTGGGSGIGRGIALRLAAHGADVVVADLNPDGAKAVAKEVEAAGRRSLVTETNVGDQAATDAMIAAAIERFGKVDILVNNAGIFGAPGWWERTQPSLEDWDSTFDVNVFGIVHATQSVESHMLERGSGKIVNIASAAGRAGAGGSAHYAASKASAINVTQAWAYKLAPHGINVNCICPGLLWTPLWEKLVQRRQMQGLAPDDRPPREAFEHIVAERVPLGREQTPEDVGNAAAFLASDRAAQITGQALNVDGGSVVN